MIRINQAQWGIVRTRQVLSINIGVHSYTSVYRYSEFKKVYLIKPYGTKVIFIGDRRYNPHIGLHIETFQIDIKVYLHFMGVLRATVMLVTMLR